MRTDLLVLQGTPFCNIACTYCYLPDRGNRARMDHETVERAVRWVFANGLAEDRLSIAWHAGEPLVLPPAWYETAIARAAAGAPPGAELRHCIQTNATLIDDRWCGFFDRHGINVGVSLDGPADLHDGRRRTRAGGGTHGAAMRGIAALQRNRIPFHAIAVVTSATLDQPERFFAFFEAHGITDLGLNLEEVEGVNGTSSLTEGRVAARYRRFVERVVERAVDQDTLRIREIGDLLGMLHDPAFGVHRTNDQNAPFRIVTVAHDGSIFTFSPELAGQSDPRMGDFTLGNVAATTLDDILASPRYRHLAGEIADGVARCAESCAYFRLCLGGAPSNKLAETGRMDSTETMACRLGTKAISEILLRRLEHDLAAGGRAPLRGQASHRGPSAGESPRETARCQVAGS